MVYLIFIGASMISMLLGYLYGGARGYYLGVKDIRYFLTPEQQKEVQEKILAVKNKSVI